MKKIIALTLIVFSILNLVSCKQTFPTSGKFQLHIIDIGQGDAILLKTPEGNNILIDSGPYQNYDTLKAYLLGLGIENFDKVIATHPDSDHIGSMAEIIEDFDIEEFYMPKKEHTTKSFELMVSALQNNNIPIYNPYSGDEITLSNTVKGAFLSPQNKEYDENNLYSLVLYLEHGDNSFLLMSDAETQNEYDILSDYPTLQADFIKLGHHGSSSSTTTDFIKQIQPYIATISLAKGNSFGHPHQQVVTLLKNLNIPLYRTDEQGSIVFLSDGTTIYSDKKSSGTYNIGTK